MRSGIFGVAILALACAQVQAAPAIRTSGKWVVRSEKDPFENGTTTIAVTMRGSNSLVLRCFGSKLSVILILPTNKRDFSSGQEVSYQYRADTGPISEHEGAVFSDYSVELPNASNILRDVPSAKTLAFRVTLPGGSVSTFTFDTAGGGSATAGIRSDCGAPKAASAPVASPISPLSPEPPKTPPVGRVSEDVIDRLRLQMFEDARDAVAFTSGCDTVGVDDKKLLLAIVLHQGEPDAAMAEMKAASNTKRLELLKDKDRNLCAEAYSLFGPLGSQFRNFVRLKGAAATGAQKSAFDPK